MADLTVIAASSAIGGASRRNADALAGRSRAAILPVLADMRSIAASGIFGRTAVFDGLGSLRPSERMERKCRCEPHWRPPKLKCNGVERAESDESGQRCGGSVPILGARNERKCRLGDVGVFADCHLAETKKGEPEVQRRFAPARSKATRSVPGEPSFSPTIYRR